METKISEDISEEIISQLKKINEILDKMIQEKYEKECTNPSCSRDISIRTIEEVSNGTKIKSE